VGFLRPYVKLVLSSDLVVVIKSYINQVSGDSVKGMSLLQGERERERERERGELDRVQGDRSELNRHTRHADRSTYRRLIHYMNPWYGSLFLFPALALP